MTHAVSDQPDPLASFGHPQLLASIFDDRVVQSVDTIALDDVLHEMGREELAKRQVAKPPS